MLCESSGINSMNNYWAFSTCSVRVEDHQTEDVFYVYPDRTQQQQQLPETLEDAYDNGFLTISYYGGICSYWYLNIANEEYTGPLHEMQRILWDWAKSEGYVF